MLRIYDESLNRNTPELLYRSAVFQIMLLPVDPKVFIKGKKYLIQENNKQTEYAGEFIYTITGAKFTPVGKYSFKDAKGKRKSKQIVTQKAYGSASTNNGFVRSKDLKSGENIPANFKEILVARSKGTVGSFAKTILDMLQHWHDNGNTIAIENVRVILPHKDVFEAKLTDQDELLLDKIKDATFKYGFIESPMAYYLHRVAYDLKDNKFISVDGDTIYSQTRKMPEYLRGVTYLAVGKDNVDGNSMGKGITTLYGFKNNDYSLIGIKRNDNILKRIIIDKQALSLPKKPDTRDKEMIKTYRSRLKENLKSQPLLEALEMAYELGINKYKYTEDFDVNDRIWIHVPTVYEYGHALDAVFNKATRYIKHRGSKAMLVTSVGEPIMFNPRRTKLTRIELDRMQERFRFEHEDKLFLTKPSRKIYKRFGRPLMCCPQHFKEYKEPFGFRVMLEPNKIIDDVKTIQDNYDNYKVRAKVKETFNGKPMLVEWYIRLDKMFESGYIIDTVLTHSCVAMPHDYNKIKDEFSKKCLAEPTTVEEIKNKMNKRK